MTENRRKKPIRVRPWLRAIHRDVGYFAVGLTFIYALSGLAVNHIQEWDPNFTQVQKTHQLPDMAALPKEDEALAGYVLKTLSIEGTPSDVYRSTETRLEISLEDGGTVHLDTSSGQVFEERQEARFFIRVANWLHLNRGKKAWTYVADAYAVFLLYLATSGLFMLPGRKGLLGRGAIIAVSGALIPVAYVVLSGGP